MYTDKIQNLQNGSTKDKKTKEGRRPQTNKYLSQSPGHFFLDDDILHCILSALSFYGCNIKHKNKNVSGSQKLKVLCCFACAKL
jgi:hypothetical protein